MPRTLSSATQGAIVLSAFLVPVLTYLYFTRSQNKTTKASAGPLPPPTEIEALYIHPIKSCHGISVKTAKLLPTGFDLDRQWMWVSYPSHEFLTIRQNAKMTLIRPSYDASTDTLTVTAPAPNSPSENLSFTIPAHPTPQWLSENTTVQKSKIWSTWTETHVYSASLTSQFTKFFSQEIRLVYKPPFSPTPRPLVSNGAPKILGRSASTCFPDLMPLLIGNASSLAELNSRLESASPSHAAIPATRFRPNILVRGDPSAPWDEDRWKTVRISPRGPHGGAPMEFDITQRCARCRVPNVDSETGVEDQRQPWDVLMKYRRVDEGIVWKPCFGMLCVPREGAAGEGRKVKVGDRVEVVEVTGGHRYIAGF